MAGCFSENHVSTGDLNRPRSPEVRKPLACFLVLFARRKKNKTVLPCRELRGSANLEAVRPNNNFPLTQLNPFAAPRPFRRPWRHYFLLLTQQIFALRAIIGGCAAFETFLSPPTWSPCSRPFAILPVSAVSDAQKLATGNFLHVRAESLSLPDGTLRVLFSPPLAAFLLFPAGNFSILFVRHKKYDKKALPAGSLPPPAALFLLLPQQVLPPPAASFPAESRLFSC